MVYKMKKLENSFDDVIEALESKLSKEDIKYCRDTAELSAFHIPNITYRGAYITALMQKLNSNTGGKYNDS